MATFRNATIDDFKFVQNIQNQVHAKHVKADPFFFRDVENSLDQHFFEEQIRVDQAFILENKNKIIGYAFIHLIETIKHPLINEQKILFIDDFGINNELKRKGYGRELFNSIMQYSRKINCTSIELSVWSFNQEAKDFYKNMDMKVIMIRMKKEIIY